MKRSLSLVPFWICAIALMSLIGCSSNPMVGTWKMELANSADPAAKAAAGSMDVSVTFKADNTYSAEMSMMGQKASSSGKYKLEGNSLTMTSEMEDGKAVASPKSETTTLSADKKSFDLPGSNGQAKMVKQ